MTHVINGLLLIARTESSMVAATHLQPAYLSERYAGVLLCFGI